MVSYADVGFEFVLEKSPSRLSELLSQNLRNDVPDDSIVEISPASIAVANTIGRHIQKYDGAALIIDYGYLSPHPKDTLQAVQHHKYVHVLDAPGCADITAHVDFSTIARTVHGFAKVHGPVDQGEWLKRLGITHRRDKLMADANEHQMHEIELAYRRLTDSNQMGTLFKVIVITRTNAPAPAGFDGSQ
jgi:NADH dehydrogenase [ubiquinone] 1 alpha subcomplex assembly factor 7